VKRFKKKRSKPTRSHMTLHHTVRLEKIPATVGRASAFRSERRAPGIFAGSTVDAARQEAAVDRNRFTNNEAGGFRGQKYARATQLCRFSESRQRGARQ